MLEALQERFTRCQKSVGLSSLREASWEKLRAKGLPSKQHGAFREQLGYFPLTKFYEDLFGERGAWEATKTLSQELEQHRLACPEAVQLVFLNGVYNEALSQVASLPKQVGIFSLEQAEKGSYGPFLQHRMESLLAQEEDFFALLQGAFCPGGAFLYIPPQIRVAVPIQFVFLQTDAQLVCSAPRVHVFLGSGASAQFVSSLGEASFHNGFVDFALEEEAQASHIAIGHYEGSGWHCEALRASLKKKSRFRSCLATFGAKGVRHDYKVALLGAGADAGLAGILTAAKGDQTHVHVHMDHSAPECLSNQLFKQVLLDRSRASFTGKIYVRRSAQKTLAYQLHKNLLLSNQAIAYSKPNLEIFADDVKASHGATVAQLDNEQLLYLQSRGIPAQQAAALLTEGFCQEVLEQVEIPSLQRTLWEQYRRFLQERR